MFSSGGGSLTTLSAGSYFAVDGVTIGRVTTNTAGTLTLAFNANATESLVNKAMQQIAYGNTSDAPPATVQIDWTFNDGNTGAQGTGGALSATGSTTVQITAVNDAPYLTTSIPDLSVQANSNLNYVIPAGTFVDPDGDVLNWSMAMADGTGVPPWLTFNRVTKTLSGTPASHDAGNFLLRITATDAAGSSATDYVNVVVRNNTPPNGGASIAGTPTQGQTLSANTAALADVDGLGAFSYQWLRGGVAIGGATASTYQLMQADVGAAISLKVSYTDGGGTVESVTSGVTLAVANVDDEATGTLSVSGSPQEGGVLAASLSAVTDIDGATTTTWRWQLLSGSWVDLAGQTGPSLSIPSDQSDVGKNVRVVATTLDALGGTTDFIGSALVVANVNDAPTATSSVKTGNEDTVFMGQLAATDEDGDALSYSRFSNPAHGSVVVNLNGSYTYTPAANYVGPDSFSFKANDGALESNAATVSLTIAPVNDAPTGNVVLAGIPVAGQTLTVSNTLADADGMGIVSYQWLAAGADIAGATGSSFVLTTAQVGKSITVLARYTDGAGTPESVLSNASDPVTSFNTILGTNGPDILDGINGPDLISGLAGDDTLYGGAGDDRFIGGLGDDLLLGGGDQDTVVYADALATYTITQTPNGVKVSGPEGTDILRGVETLRFADATLQLNFIGGVDTGEVQVNTTTIGTQFDPSVTALSDDGWLVCWTAWPQEGMGIYQQRYNLDGTTSGVETKVSTTTIGSRQEQDVTNLNDGGWLVSWMSEGQDGNGWGIYQQRYTATGTPSGIETRVNTTTANHQMYSSVAPLSDGGWLVCWMSENQDVPGDWDFGIYQQRYSANGAPSGAQTRVNSTKPGDQRYPSVVSMTDGGWLVIWTSDGQDGDDWGIYQQRYTAAGTPSGVETRVNTTTEGIQTGPIVTSLRDGGWLVSWMSVGQDGNGLGIYQQRYTAAGTPSGVETRVNTTTAEDQVYPSVTGLRDGGWLVTWQSLRQDGSGWGIYQQRYTAAGTPSGVETRVNTTTADSQSQPRVTALNDGGWLVTWQSNDQDGSFYGIYSQRYEASGESFGALTLAITGDDSSQQLIGGSAGDTISGMGGNDTLGGGLGRDSLFGGAGTDTALYSGAITDYLIRYNRGLGQATVTDLRPDGDGTNSLSSIERLQFGSQLFDLLNPPRTAPPVFATSRSFLFDAANYLLDNPDLVPSVTLATAFDHYNSTGAAQHRAPTTWFDPVYYANRWPDLTPLHLDAATLFAHYNLYGVWEGRSAGPVFDRYDGNRYLSENPDVAAYVDAYVADFLGSRSNGAIAHYVIYGAAEGRVAYDLDGQPLDMAIVVGVAGG